MIIDQNHTVRIHKDLGKLNKVIISETKLNRDKYVIIHSDMEKKLCVCVYTYNNLKLEVKTVSK